MPFKPKPKLFTVRVVTHWNRLGRLVKSPSLETGHRPEQTAPVEPALSSGVELEDLQRYLLKSAIL